MAYAKSKTQTTGRKTASGKTVAEAPKKKYSQSEVQDKEQIITDKLLGLMESGTIPWEKSWRCATPGNLKTGKDYRGGNPLLCQIFMLDKGYEHPYFLSFMQGKDLGLKMNKGAKAIWLTAYNARLVEIEKESGEIEDEWRKYFGFQAVYNVADFEGYEQHPLFQKRLSINETKDNPTIEYLQNFVDAQKAEIQHIAGTPCYSPSLDKISIPAIGNFENSERYYATLIHELAHRTGAKNRLDRKLCGKFGDKNYAFEELVAEITSAFICNILGINTLETDRSSAGYLQGWLSALKNDKTYFLKALRLASKASQYMLKNAGMVEDYQNSEENM